MSYVHRLQRARRRLLRRSECCFADWVTLGWSEQDVLMHEGNCIVFPGREVNESCPIVDISLLERRQRHRAKERAA